MLGLLWSFAAAAEEAKPLLAVLDLEAREATPPQAEAATLGVLRGLRALDVFQVLSASDIRQLLALERQRQVLGAGQGDFPALSRSLGAEHVVAGTLTRVGSGFQVELRLLDTRQSSVLSQKALGPVAKMEELAVQLPGLAQELVAPLLATQQGSLLVRSREEAAEVLVDDALVASTPMASPVKLARGTHRLQVRKDGFIAQARSVKIQPDQLTIEELELLPSADYAEAYRLRHGRLRVGAYLATGLAVAALAGAFAIDQGLTEPAYQKEFLPRRYALEGTLLGSVRPAQLAGDPSFVAAYNQCGASPETCAREADELRGRISTQQWVTGGLAGVGVLAAGAAAYLWITGEDPNRYANLVASVGAGGAPSFAVVGRF